MKTPTLFLSLLASFILSGTSLLNATVLLDETFGPTVPSEWTTTNAAVTLSTSNTVGLTGYALVYSRSSSGGTDTAQSAYRTFTSTTLAEAGDVLTVSFSYKGLEYANNNGNRVLFGFFNSNNGTSMSTADGYVGLLRADARTDRSAPYSQFRALDNGPSFNLSTGYAGTTYNATVTAGSQFYLSGIAADNTGNINDVFSFSYSITRQVNGDLLLSQTFTNINTSAAFTSQATIAAVDVLTYTFDTFDFGYNRTGPASFAIDNLLVTVVPEPTSFALLLAGAGWIFLFRRGCKKVA